MLDILKNAHHALGNNEIELSAYVSAYCALAKIN